MNLSDGYNVVISVVREHVLTERLFLASIELALLAGVVGLVTRMGRLKMPRLAALMWVVVLVKPLVSLCVGSPIPVLQLAGVSTDAVAFEQPEPGKVTHGEDTPGLGLATNSVSIAKPAEAPCLEPMEQGAYAESVLEPTVSSQAALVEDSGWNVATWLILGWAVGVGVMLLTSLTRQIRLWRILSLSKQPSAELSDQTQRLGRALGMRRVPKLRITSQLDSPALAGVVQPVILIPEWLTAGQCSPSAVTWSLRHELMHWKLGDPIVNWISGFVQSLFFFHPIAWWSARQWRCAMELACDRALVSSAAEARSYAEGLYHVLAAVKDRRRVALAGSLFATRTQIGQRIEVLLSGQMDSPRQSRAVVLAVLIVLSAVGLSVGGQFADEPEVDAVAEQVVQEKPAASSSEQMTIERTHVVIAYSGAGESYAAAVGRTVEAARAIAVEQFGFDMPETIHVTLKVDPAARTRLFNDGDSHVSLTVRSERDLLPPSSSGIFHIYGLCHEVGHLAMYRPIQNRSWMTTAAAEGWAHYIGSRLVDAVYEREGRELWPDPYDYLGDGTLRLGQQLAASSPGPMTQGAGLWKLFAETVGDKGIAPIFDTWGRAQLDSMSPGEELGRLLLQANEDKRLSSWWNRAETVFVIERSPSQFVADTIDSDQVASQSDELALDDGEPAGTQSIAGSGHAVRFRVASDSQYLTSVRIHGRRYGSPRPPKEDFHVWLCDKDFNEIADFPFPYSKFPRGPAEWVSLGVKPTQVPREFIVCVGFNPTATKGVFVSRDDQSSGSSLTGVPGRPARVYDQGDWLIRATLGSVSAVRTWKDSSGLFSVQAELQEVVDGKVRLKKSDGTVIAVPIDKLSAEDRRFLDSRAGNSAGPASSAPRLSGKPEELSSDDGRPAGQRSFPMGFAVAFTAPSDSSYLTSVRIHGARYGSPRVPNQDFHVSLCDKDFNMIADFAMPYSRFRRGEARWVSLRIKPTKVPKEFVICLDFKPTRTNGVYLSHDADGRGLMGTPGKRSGSFSGGDWLLRASVDQPAATD